MKKVIAILVLFLYLLPINTIHATSTLALEISGTVEGYENIALSNDQLVTVSITEPGYAFNVTQNQDVTSWFNYYIPEGLSAQIVSAGENEVTVMFSGIPEETVDYEQIVVFIEADDNNYILDISDSLNPLPTTNDLYNEPNDDNYYFIDVQDTIAYYDDDYVVKGYVGEELESNIVRIKLDGSDGLKKEVAYPNPSQIETITTVDGLEAYISEYDPSTHTLTIIFEGIPQEESHDLIITTILKELCLYETDDYENITSETVLFDIIPKPEPEHKHHKKHRTYELPVTGIE